MLNAGADVDGPSGKMGERAALALALALAAVNGRKPIVMRILEASANTNLAAHRYMGCTPLRAASWQICTSSYR